MAANLSTNIDGRDIVISLTHTLDPKWYTHPLTLKTLLPNDWQGAKVTQGDAVLEVVLSEEHGQKYALYDAMPNAGDIRLSEAE